MIEAKDAIRRLCRLHAEVALKHVGVSKPSDCFCGEGGFWASPEYDGTYEGGYRNTGEAIEFIENAVRVALGGELDRQRNKAEFYQRRCDALQKAQTHMRDPERKMVCDILANGKTYEKPHDEA